MQYKKTPVVRLELPVAILTSYLAGELVHNFAAKVLIEMQAQTQLTADKGCQLRPHCYFMHASINPWQLTAAESVSWVITTISMVDGACMCIGFAT